MQAGLLDFLKCPITKTALRFELIQKFDNGTIKEGLLYSETGFVFPVTDGIPRMLIESIYDYAGFLRQHLENYDQIRQRIEQAYSGLLHYCVAKNAKTKKSFAFEWSFLKPEKNDKIWHSDIPALSQVFLKETGWESTDFKDKTVIDVGCGHGMMTSAISKMSRLAIGVEISKAVEMAYRRNSGANAWYVQGDLQFLPFGEHAFDVLYSSGVIHHTNNTELSLSLIEPVLKNKGRICLWLYHPQKDIFHHISLFLRAALSRLPLQLSFMFIMIFIFPVSFLIKKTKGKKISYREEIIHLLDAFTPQYRYEIPDDLAKLWLQRRKYSGMEITAADQFGFSIAANKC